MAAGVRVTQREPKPRTDREAARRWVRSSAICHQVKGRPDTSGRGQRDKQEAALSLQPFSGDPR
jgi:hypothetical protein